METTTAIIRQENVELIVRNAPQSYQENQISHDRCIEYGQQLLNAITSAGQMTDELDQRAADYIERSRKTVRKMNEKRTPVTKLFDQIRAVYTGLENDIDPNKSGSIPERLQYLRNQYAAEKRREAEERRREEERRLQRENTLGSYRNAVESDYKQSFNRMLNNKFNDLVTLNSSVTLDNYAEVEAKLKKFPTTLSEDWVTCIPSGVPIPALLTPDECLDIRRSVMTELLPKFREQYTFDMGENRDNILRLLPSKKQELEAIARSNAAARREAELKAREAGEAARREAERRRREEEERQQLQVKQQQQELQGLFGQAAATATAYQPKTSVKKRIVVNNPLGFLEIIQLWWTTEGFRLSLEELNKKFKSQITLCEKLANDKQNPRFIESQYITYEDEVKAK